eukprot:498293-Rhodomonas_salina.1
MWTRKFEGSNHPETETSWGTASGCKHIAQKLAELRSRPQSTAPELTSNKALTAQVTIQTPREDDQDFYRVRTRAKPPQEFTHLLLAEPGNPVRRRQQQHAPINEALHPTS